MRVRPLAGLIGLSCLTTAASSSVVQDFGDYTTIPNGTVVAGETPDGGTAPGTLFGDFIVSGITYDPTGPNSVIIFDSNHPYSRDYDLGTPNETCTPAGPGVGVGGEVGMPGENCVDRGNLLIIPEQILDGNGDGRVDEPCDERDGGEIAFDFVMPVFAESITIMDIDSETAAVELIEPATMSVTVDATDLGDNSAQTLELPDIAITRLRVVFSSSGAIADLTYEFAPTPVLERTWGQVKAEYR